MMYQTVGYVKTLTIKSTGNDGVLIGFAPTGSYLFEDQETTYCIFQEGVLNTKDTTRAVMRQIDKDGVVAMSVADISMRDALIAAKVNHSKVRIKVKFDFANKKKKAAEGEIVIFVIEFL